MIDSLIFEIWHKLLMIMALVGTVVILLLLIILVIVLIRWILTLIK